MAGIEPATYALRKRCSTPELHRQQGKNSSKAYAWQASFHSEIFAKGQRIGEPCFFADVGLFGGKDSFFLPLLYAAFEGLNSFLG